MAIPVKFYSVTQEEYEKIRKRLEEAKSKETTLSQEEKELDGGIFFVEDTNEIHKS